MDGVLSPPPRPLIFQARGGPFLGHCLRRPVSLECAVRSGPCHCGQSLAEAEDKRNPAARALIIRFILIINFYRFVCGNVSVLTTVLLSRYSQPDEARRHI